MGRANPFPVSFFAFAESSHKNCAFVSAPCAPRRHNHALELLSIDTAPRSKSVILWFLGCPSKKLLNTLGNIRWAPPTYGHPIRPKSNKVFDLLSVIVIKQHIRNRLGQITAIGFGMADCRAFTGD